MVFLDHQDWEFLTQLWTGNAHVFDHTDSWDGVGYFTFGIRAFDEPPTLFGFIDAEFLAAFGTRARFSYFFHNFS